MNSLDSFLLGDSRYQIRHVNGRIVGATRLDIGRHVDPDELRTLAVRLGRWNALLGTVALAAEFGEHSDLTAEAEAFINNPISPIAFMRIGDDRRGGDE